MAASDDENAPLFAEGDVLAGKYRIERVLGRGGMGVVVAAMHLQLRQRVALKFLLPDATAEVTERFQREARAAARLRSDHVARVVDVGELPNGAPYMVMEYLEGSDLSRVLRKRGPLPIEDAVDYVLQACEAIAEAHMAGIVHRDLKPANLFLTTAADGSASVKVLDFGISKDRGEGVEEEEMNLTRTKAVLGSPHYMAPEQMRSTRTVDARADIWSLGVILYQLLTKAVPHKAGSFVELVLKVNGEDAPPPSNLRSDIPPPLEEAILRCLRRKQEDRFATVAELAAALAPFGRPEAMVSAAKIARTQGVTPPPIERPSLVGMLPPPSLATASLGTPSSGGPSIPPSSIPPPPSVSSPSGSPSVAPPSTSGAVAGKTGEGRPSQPADNPAVQTGGTGAAWSTGGPSQTRVARARRLGLVTLIGGGAAVAVVAALGILAPRRGPAPAPSAMAAPPAPPPSAAVAPVASVVAEPQVQAPALAATTGRVVPASIPPAPTTAPRALASQPVPVMQAPVVQLPVVPPPIPTASQAPVVKPPPPPPPAVPPAPSAKKNILDIEIQ